MTEWCRIPPVASGKRSAGCRAAAVSVPSPSFQQSLLCSLLRRDSVIAVSHLSRYITLENVSYSLRAFST